MLRHTGGVKAITTEDPTGLAAALRAAAAQVIIDRGLGAFSIREVARRAGVSHAAPGYHFGDSQGLLTALAIEGFETLHREMQAAVSGVSDPIEQLTLIGRAYVRVATQFPAHCEVIFREDVINAENADYERVSLQAFGLLETTVQAIADAHNHDLPVVTAARLCWSAMQGLVELQAKMARLDKLLGQETLSIEDTAERFSALLISGLVNHRTEGRN